MAGVLLDLPFNLRVDLIQIQFAHDTTLLCLMIWPPIATRYCSKAASGMHFLSFKPDPIATATADFQVFQYLSPTFPALPMFQPTRDLTARKVQSSDGSRIE